MRVPQISDLGHEIGGQQHILCRQVPVDDLGRVFVQVEKGPWIRPPEWIGSMLEGCWGLSQVGRPDSSPVSPSATQGVGSQGGNTHPGTV